MPSESKEEAAFGFRGAIADRAALLAGGADHAELKSDYERFCQNSGTRNMKLEGVRCPESQVGHYTDFIRGHVHMTSAKISGFLTPFPPPCLHLGLIYSIEFMQPPLLHLLFWPPLLPRVQTSYAWKPSSLVH